MKTSYKNKAVIVFFLTICLLGRGSYSVSAKNSLKNNHGDKTRYVVVCGTPVGIRLKSHGVIITGFIGYTTENNEYFSPAKEAGLKEGDRIIGINGACINSIDDMQDVLENCTEPKILLSLENSQGKFEKDVTLNKDSETNELKLGIWGRDSISGIGTLTFFDEESGMYGALGHAISDGREPYDISGGCLKAAEITGIKKGVAGSPGELRGFFRENDTDIGDVRINCAQGIFGHINKLEGVSNSTEFCRLAVANNSEIHKGNAYIMTSAPDGEVKKYSIEITQINKESADGTKCFNLRVTDKRLLECTGGIVQGMSGSPILQNGKLIGAVTHVLVDDPTKGYGIFAENMLETARGVAEEQNLKDAS